MSSKLAVLLLVCYFVSCFNVSFSEKRNSFESVPDLERTMYTQIGGYPCVRLLNISGEIGCSNPGRGTVVAPVVEFKNSSVLVQSSTIVVSIDDFESLIARLSKDSNFSSNVAGILVKASTQIQNNLRGNSPDVRFPLAEFAPYKTNNFEWNPIGSGIMWKSYNFPVFLLSETSTPIVQEALAKSEKRNKPFIEDVVEFDMVMQTTKSGYHDSDACLKNGACLPLGGYSVWSAIPPLNVSLKPKPIILTMTSMDAASFFRDKSLGADSPISGLITLLAAVDALSGIQELNDLDKQLVFLVFTGEAWGYLGSRRFMLELDQHSDTVKELNMDGVEMVLEIGSVGKCFSEGMKTLFAHTSGDTSSVNGTLNALQRAQDSLNDIVVKRASISNPGIPPSSLMTFMQKRQISGVVLEDFDNVFANKFYHSHLDNLSNINSSAVEAAASLVARTLYILAGGNQDSVVNNIKVNTSLIEELLGCLLNCEPGLSCALVKQYISPGSTCPSHYVGVILGEPSSVPFPGYVGDISRFVWNFLADKTSNPPNNRSSACPNACSGVGELCIRKEADGKGSCLISTTRYVPAYSTRLKYESGGWVVLPYNSSDSLSVEDPVWTESNWDSLHIRLYTVQDASYDRLILLLGISVTVVAYISIMIARTFIRKAMKQD